MEKSKRVTLDKAKQILSRIDNDKYIFANIGRNNWVFLSDNKCISIPKNSEKIQYNIRVSAMQFLQEQNIPTTKLIEYDKIEGIEYIITEKILTTEINLIETSKKFQKNIFEQCAETAYKLHQIKVPGFGRLDKNLIGAHNTWKEFVGNYLEGSMKRLKSSEDLWNLFSQRINERFKSNEQILDESQKSFLHGDYHVGNMLFYKNQLKAIIDLDLVMSGDKYWDLGHYLRTSKGNRDLGKNIFKNVYGEWDEEKSKFYSMIIWTRKIASQGENRRNALAETIPEMEDILR